MTKTIDERLFEQLMRAPHEIRRIMFENRFGGPCPEGSREHHRPEGPRGPMGCRAVDDGRGHGPAGMPGSGCMHRGHSPEHCHGPEHGPGHGPGRAFMRERLLGVIAGYEGGVRQKTLTEELRINPSSVSELISKLQSDGYVRRTVDPDDKRATLIVLTELGEARAAELADERQARFAGVFSALTEEEKEQLLSLLEKLTEPSRE